MKKPPANVRKFYDSAPLPHRRTMLVMRERILEIAPDAEEVVSYGMPGFKVKGTIVALLRPAKNHVGYYPYSGGILSLFAEELAKYNVTTGALHVPVDAPLSKTLLKKLIGARISQCEVKSGRVDSSKYGARDAYWRSIGLAAPARRGLVDNGLLELADLRKLTEQEFHSIHGIGGNAAELVRAVMKSRRVAFRS